MRATRLSISMLSITLAAATLLAGGADAQSLSRSQQQCLRDFHQQTARVQRALGKNALGCVRRAGAGRETDARGCVQEDARGAVARAERRLADRTERSCQDRPEFGTTDSGAVAATLAAEQWALIARLYGGDLDAALVPDRDGARCQSEVLRRATRFQDAQWRAVIRASRRALDAGVADADAYARELLDARGGDPKVASALRQIEAKVGRRCPTSDAARDLLPGRCADSANLTACVAAAASCSFCRSLGATTELPLACDTYDDGQENQSCSDLGAPLFVAVDGNDAGDGTREAPLATLEAALARASDGGFGRIRMAAGVYAVAGNPLVDGVSIEGG
ncbi:MAG: hypothetical protein ACR2PQ_10475, partial [Myxococcota bacterium]